MLKRVSHTTVWVLDQERAKKFYTEQLGFEVRHDVTMGAFRWLTVGLPSQPDLELVLMEPQASPLMDEATAATVRDLVQRGVLGAGVVTVADCHATYAELSAKGVLFREPPQERPYGIEAMMSDDSGNWYSVTQPR
ncbi:MAG: VOC family protein [Myxococcota bacterium]